MSTPNNPDLVAFAEKLADEARVIAARYFRTPLEIISKDDDSPVTRADREIEQRLRDLIQSQRPGDGILGEEFGTIASQNGLTWVIDPIDGTKSFTIGRPTFGTLIGLCQGETPVLGVIDQPITKERWIGQSGQPTTYNGTPVRTRACPSLKKAIFATGSPTQISKNDPQRFDRLQEATRYPVFQGDCYFYGLMANGFMDLIVESQLGIYDFIALVPVIEGAGGIMTDWNGNAKTLNGDATVVACGDPNLHKAALAAIGAYSPLAEC